ncbi:MAG: VOC family protein [Polaromonas sp.]|nr:VOC family protein [Polaromonas sp.]
MELQASLKSIHLHSPDPAGAAHFYAQVFDMKSVNNDNQTWICHAPGRQLLFSSGPANQLNYAHFAFADPAVWQAFQFRTAVASEGAPGNLEGLPAKAFVDPDGNRIIFTGPADVKDKPEETVPPAVLQHLALRSADVERLAHFYTDILGFVLSDSVRGPDDSLRACFLRSDNLHHALALFASSTSCFDHQSFEVPDWASMKIWGDRMAGFRVPIVWGIGRHGPGNDVFFMVRDPDGNLVEISAELEHCLAGRPAGSWPHEERTLNVWGKAIMRS